MNIEQQILIDRILAVLVARPDITTKDDFQRLQNELYAGEDVAEPFPTIDYIERYRALVREGVYIEDPRIQRVLRKRAIRSLSGIAVVSVLTRPYACPGQCVYCPNYTNLPKSYVPDEPAVMRAELNEFDPIRQVQNRLYALTLTGHTIDKCDIRIIGGTWSSYPQEYREDFVKALYDAHTEYARLSEHIESDRISGRFGTFHVKDDYTPACSASLAEAQSRNESAVSRVIGIAVETRPDVVTSKEIAHMRSLGVTRVEIGYQSTDDAILKLNKRGHGRAEIVRAVRLLRDAGMKIVAHVMPGLLGSTPERDREVMYEILTDPDLIPDELKIYPTVVVPHSELEGLYRAGGYVPYDDSTLIDLVADLVAMIPEHIRLNRLYRDIPSSHIIAGCRLANLRQVVETRIAETGRIVTDISHREVRARVCDPDRAILDEVSYPASGGIEYFLQWVDPVDRTLYAVLRLRVPPVDTDMARGMPALAGAAIIREVHVFGDHLRIGEGSSKESGQHRGFGRRLIERATEIIRTQHPLIRRIAVTSGVGVRGYYVRLGYHLEDGYMVFDFSR